MTTDCLPWALEYARRGLVVLPLAPFDKTAYQKGHYCECKRCGPSCTCPIIGSSDPNWITQTWSQQSSANLGIACGERSRLMVLDVDVERNGHTDLALWENDRRREGNLLPPHASYTTATGGRHHWFRLPAGMHLKRNDHWLRGVEVKACGGYVAVPPTIRRLKVETLEDGFIQEDEVCRAYIWDEGVWGLPGAPDWLLHDVQVRFDGVGKSSRNGYGAVRGKDGDVTIKMPPPEEFMERGLGWFYAGRNEDAHRLARIMFLRLGTSDANLAEVLEVMRSCWQATADKTDSSWREIAGAVESARGQIRTLHEQERPSVELLQRWGGVL